MTPVLDLAVPDFKVRLCAADPSVAAVSLPTDFEVDPSRSCTLVACVNLHGRASCCVTALRLKCFLATGTLLRLKCFLATGTLRPRVRASSNWSPQQLEHFHFGSSCKSQGVEFLFFNDQTVFVKTFLQR
ncbi:hypothetical protein NDU88_002693 [Pleurodeles waltl]|uniref:Uncharacterized protein n=1 Tax=Pleurodeles waltl TaxID=8319 RepID=A0AAV7RAQ9_PLEWA|nr:hypothetical protein NDU88_002693 [Pleurodeles waltl]